MGVPLYTMCCFPLVDFHILFISNFCCFNYSMFWWVPHWNFLFPGLVYFLCHVRKFFNHYVFDYVLRFLLSLSFPSRVSVIQILVCLALSQRSSKLDAFIFPFFSSVQCWWFPLLSSSSVTIVLYHLVYYWLLVYFSFLSLYTHFALEFFDHWTLLGRLPIPTSLHSSSGALYCSFFWNMLLCHLILPQFLFLFLFIWYIGFVSTLEKWLF